MTAISGARDPIVKVFGQNKRPDTYRGTYIIAPGLRFNNTEVFLFTGKYC